MENMDFWTCSGGFDYENDIAPGHLSRRQRSRALRKHDIALGIAEIGRHVCFKKDSAAAPPPDPQIGRAATENAALGKEWLEFSKQQFKEGNIRQDQYDKLIEQVVASDLATQKESKQWATEDRADGKAARDKFNYFSDRAENLGNTYGGQLDDVANGFGRSADSQLAFGDSQRGRYGSTFAPIEDRFAKDAMEWDSDARLATEAGKARADVLAEAQLQNEARTRSMSAMGVNPNSGRFAGISRAGDINTALGAAGAANMARDNVRAQGVQLRGQAAQLGQQVLGSGQSATSLGLQARSAQQGAAQAAYGAKSSGTGQAQQATTAGLAALGIGNTSANTSLNAGSAAVGAGGAGNQQFIANQGVMAQGFQGAIGANNSAGQILNSQYGNQVSAFNAAQSAGAQKSAGTGQAIGGVVAAGIMVF